MDQMGLVRTKRNGHWTLIPCPPNRSRAVDNPNYTTEMLVAQEKSGHSPETLALWQPVSEVQNMTDTVHTAAVMKQWRQHLRLDWTVDRLPRCTNCQFSTFKCTERPPQFHCRILTMTNQHSLRPNQYWARLVEFG